MRPLAGDGHDRASRRHRKCASWPTRSSSTTSSYHYEILSKRLRELSFLNNGVKIRLVDQRQGKEENFAFSGGVKGFVEYINRAKTVLHPNIFSVSAESAAERHVGRRGSGDAVERLLQREACCASPTTSRSATAART